MLTARKLTHVLYFCCQDILHVLAVQAQERLFWLNQYPQSKVDTSLFYHPKLRDVQIALDLARLVTYKYFIAW